MILNTSDFIKLEDFEENNTNFKKSINKNNLNQEGKHINTTYYPILLEANKVTQICNDLEVLSSLNEKLISLYRDNLEIKNFYHIYNKYPKFFTKPIQRKMISFSRFDLIINHSNIKVMESNTCCPGGIFYKSILNEIWLYNFSKKISNQILLSQIVDSPYKNLTKEFLDIFSKEFPDSIAQNAALVNINGVYTNELELIKAQLELNNIKTYIVDVRDLDVSVDSKEVSYKNNKIDMIYHKLSPGMLLKEYKELENYITAYNNNAFCALNTFDAILLTEDKSSLAIFSDPNFHHLFTNNEKEIIKHYIPWTRKLVTQRTLSSKEEDIKDFFKYCLYNKDELVIKPCNKTRGQGIIIGKNCNVDEWENVLINCFDNEYIIQEFVSLPKIDCTKGRLENMFYGIETYMINGKARYFTSRASNDEIINIGKEGIVLPCFIGEIVDGSDVT